MLCVSRREIISNENMKMKILKERRKNGARGLLSEMNSIGPECSELKAKYDSCFNVWFSEKFLKGKDDEDMCKPLFILYRQVPLPHRPSHVKVKKLIQSSLRIFNKDHLLSVSPLIHQHLDQM